MQKHLVLTTCALVLVSFLTACSTTKYQAAQPQAATVDLTEFAPRVDTFVVLLDTSGSMRDDDPNQAKYQTAHNMVANFNNAVPEAGFNAGMVIFGKGAGSCMGDGVARKIYGMTTYSNAKFLAALNSIDCVRSTTPILGALDLGTDMLSGDRGEIALIIFSDFKWSDPQAVQASIADLRSEHEGRLCLHTVRIGDFSSNSGFIDELHAGDNCGSAVNAADITPPAAMTDYVANILMAPLEYERFNLSAMTLFDFDKSVLKAAGKTELNKLSEYIKSRGIRITDIDVVGHTDSVGTEAYNVGLSERRASAVQAYMIEQGVNAAILSSTGMGELDPVAPNTTAANRALNRRVEVLVGAARPAAE